MSLEYESIFTVFIKSCDFTKSFGRVKNIYVSESLNVCVYLNSRECLRRVDYKNEKLKIVFVGKGNDNN